MLVPPGVVPAEFSGAIDSIERTYQNCTFAPLSRTVSRTLLILIDIHEWHFPLTQILWMSDALEDIGSV